MRHHRFPILLCLILCFAGTVLFAGDDAKTVARKLQHALNTGNTEQAAGLIRELGDIGDTTAATVLLQIATRVTAPELVSAYRDALGRIDEGTAVRKMAKLLKRPSRKKDAYVVRAIVAEAFGRTEGHEKTVCEALGKAGADDPSGAVRRAAVRSLGERKSAPAVDALIDILKEAEETHGRLWYLARQRLTSLTGQDLDKAREWREWWKPRRKTFDFEADRGSKKTATTTVRNRPTYFNREVDTNHVLFVIDISGSMVMWDPSQEFPSDYQKGVPQTRVRLERAKAELIRVLKTLEPPIQFNVIAFSDGVRQLDEELMPANRRNKKEALEFVKGLKATGGTHTDRAIERAFSMESVDTIYLLSDGAPMKTGDEEQDARLIEEILEETRKQNLHRRVRIYTFGFDGPGIWPKTHGPRPTSLKKDKSDTFIDFMKRLAEQNYGKYESLE